MFKNLLFVETEQLNCHEALYRDGVRKQERLREQEISKQIEDLKQQLVLEDPPSPKKCTRDFYNYSMNWKNSVKQKQFQNQYSEQQQSRSRSTIITKLPSNYISPVEGWKQHALQYQEKRTILTENAEHHPIINEKSRMLTFTEPVEDRLIRYGQEKEQRQQYEKQWERFYLDVEMSQKPTRANDDVFDRLYNYEKKELPVEEYSLKLNVLTPEREERVRKRREQYSLFEKKDQEQRSTSNNQRVLSQNEFDEFLRRNFCRPNIQKNNQIQEEESVDYSFKPELNKKSMEMAIQRETLVERQQKLAEKKNVQDKQEKQQKQEKQKELKVHVTKQREQKQNNNTNGNAYNLNYLIQKQYIK